MDGLLKRMIRLRSRLQILGCRLWSVWVAIWKCSLLITFFICVYLLLTENLLMIHYMKTLLMCFFLGVFAWILLWYAWINLHVPEITPCQLIKPALWLLNMLTRNHDFLFDAHLDKGIYLILQMLLRCVIIAMLFWTDQTLW